MPLTIFRQSPAAGLTARSLNDFVQFTAIQPHSATGRAIVNFNTRSFRHLQVGFTYRALHRTNSSGRKKARMTSDTTSIIQRESSKVLVLSDQPLEGCRYRSCEICTRLDDAHASHRRQLLNNDKSIIPSSCIDLINTLWVFGSSGCRPATGAFFRSHWPL